MRSNPEERDSQKAHRTRRTADGRRDSHPRRCSFPRGLHLRLRWCNLERLQFKAKGPDYHAELFPVHSPLLRESCLVSFPPLTYMLKFSGFSDLTSCRVLSRQRRINPAAQLREQVNSRSCSNCGLSRDESADVFDALAALHRNRGVLMHRDALPTTRNVAKCMRRWRL